MDSMRPDMGDKKDPHGELLRRREEIWAELQVLDLEDRDPQRRAELREELNGIAKMLSDEQVKDERLTPAQQKNTRIALIVGAAALLIGAVGPWATLLGALSVSPLSQPDEWTAVIGVALLLIVVAVISPKIRRRMSIVAGIAAIGQGVYSLVTILQAKSDSDWGSLVAPGWGLYLTIITGVYLIASTFIVKRIAPQPQPQVETA
jgi:hypothetical protein